MLWTLTVLLTIIPVYIKMGEAEKMKQTVNRTKGFINRNRFKSGKTIKQLSKTAGDKPGRKGWGGRDEQR